jgi:hypothetical protein
VTILGAGFGDQLVEERATFGPGRGKTTGSTLVEIDHEQDLVHLRRPLPELMWQDVAGVGVVGRREANLQGDAGHAHKVQWPQFF